MAEARNPQPAVGISNRETPGDEAEERREHPTLGANAPASRDPAVPEDEPSADALREPQTSRKSGSRSTAQKEAETKYPDRPMPATSKTDGAFGREADEREDTRGNR